MMKEIHIIILWLFCASIQAQTVIETFDNHNCPQSGYNNGVFKSGDNDLWWTYESCQQTVEPYTIAGNSLMLRRQYGKIESSQIQNGINSLSFKMSNCWTSRKEDRSFTIEILAESTQQTTAYSFVRNGNMTTDTTYTIDNINVDGLFRIIIINTTPTTELIIDELTWYQQSTPLTYEASIWNAFNTDPQNCDLYDYSYAGYKKGEEALLVVPEVVSVSTYGAIPNDTVDDTQAIQNAINYACSQGGGAVILESGEYLLNSLGTKADYLTLQDNVVLRGQGSGENGTVLYLSEYLNGTYGQPLITTEEKSPFTGTVYTITQDALKGTRQLKLNTTSGLSAGDVLRVRMYNPYVEGVRQNTLSLLLTEPLQPEPEWSYFAKYAPFECAFEVNRIIDGTTIELKEPHLEEISVQWNPKAEKLHFSYGIGIEDLRIESAFPGGYSHHKNWEVDYGWFAIGFKHVKDGWIKNVVIDNMTWDINLSHCMNITVKEVVVHGNDGHHGVKVDNSWFCLVKDCYFKAFRQHVIGGSSMAHANVFSDITLDYNDGMADFHGAGFMSNNLIEKVNNIHVSSGAAAENVPHSGHYNTFWNLLGNATNSSNKPGLDFFNGYWNYPSVRSANGGDFRYDCYKLHPKSLMVGVYHPHNLIEVEELVSDRDDEWIYIEGFNQAGVLPSSLYKAQLEKRLDANQPTQIPNSLVSTDIAKNPTQTALLYETAFGLTLNRSIGSAEIEIYNLSGKCVFQQKKDFAKGDIINEALATGFYLVKMETGDEIIVQKVQLK